MSSEIKKALLESVEPFTLVGTCLTND